MNELMDKENGYQKTNVNYYCCMNEILKINLYKKHVLTSTETLCLLGHFLPNFYKNHWYTRIKHSHYRLRGSLVSAFVIGQSSVQKGQVEVIYYRLSI